MSINNNAHVISKQAVPMLPDCPDTRECPPAGRTRTVFQIMGGEMHAAFGNLFYSVVSNSIIYAVHKGHVPWIKFERSWVYKTMGKEWESAGPLWEHFFEPYCPNVSAWMKACANVQLAPAKTPSWYYPFVQQKAKWAIRQWYNIDSNERLDCRREGWCWIFNDTHYARWRRTAELVVAKAHHLRPAIKAAVDARWLLLNPTQRRYGAPHE